MTVHAWRLSTLLLVGPGLMACAGEQLRPSTPPGLTAAPQSVRAVQLASARGTRGNMVRSAVASGAVLPPPDEEHEPVFCKLNPGACPEPLPVAEPGEDTAGDPWKSFACMQACDAGGKTMDAFCRNLPERTPRQRKIKALCWGVSRASKEACHVFCRAYFGPPRPSSP